MVSFKYWQMRIYKRFTSIF